MTFVKKAKALLSGKKTYIVAAVAFLEAATPIVLDWADSALTLQLAVPALWDAAVLPLLFVVLRLGVAKK